MLTAVIFPRARAVILLLAASAVLAACSSTTDGSGETATSPASVSTTPDYPTGIAGTPSGTVGTPSASVPNPSSGSGSGVQPVPGSPLKTVTVHASDGAAYVVQIWADVKDGSCFDHAYGQPMITFLTQHPCRGLERFLGTTTVHGRPVGFAESVTSFSGTATDPYKTSGDFRRLVEKDGTGSISDLLREGYRLPSGPDAVPSPDAFNCLGQDNDVTVWDAWYLDGSTPDNDPALVRMTSDIFLQF
jgi:predicted small secreted protein